MSAKPNHAKGASCDTFPYEIGEGGGYHTITGFEGLKRSMRSRFSASAQITRKKNGPCDTFPYEIGEGGGWG